MVFKTLASNMKYLNVAEKNDAAKTIAGFLSNGTARRREGFSCYNKMYEFQATIRGQNCEMIMTSVSGHLLGYKFPASYKNWNGVHPVRLFDAPVIKACPEQFLDIQKTLMNEIKKCQGLIIWTDCDREGENIGFEIINVCKGVKPNISVFRAKFSEITKTSTKRALENLTQPNELISKAVDVRQELDLRIGAAFTRFQTLRFQAIFPSISRDLVSYGSCQIPTLGFVVERYKEATNFISQAFWRIRVLHKIEDLTVEFLWARKRLFDKQSCEAFLMICQSNPEAIVTEVTEKPKKKFRPTPMDTVELEKLGSRKLKLTAKETMTIAEKLYSNGIISYPRTETNIFSKEINLISLVSSHISDTNWGYFAEKVLEWGPSPRQGKKSDQAHPPIHPTKLVTNLSGNEKKVYDLIVRHFLACVSRDAVGSETIAFITIAGEQFTANGLSIYEKNYLEVYPYENWNAKQIHQYKKNNVFQPTEITMAEGSTTAPSLLTEADLIALMEKHGIGTDATHAEHINTIKERGYIGEVDGFLIPGTLGMGLVEGYEAMELQLAKPIDRAKFEADLKLICEGQNIPEEVLSRYIQKYKHSYGIVTAKVLELDRSLAHRLNETPVSTPQVSEYESTFMEKVLKCPKCSQFDMVLRTRKNNGGFYISCEGFPDCKNAVWFPADMVKQVVGTDITCETCGPGYKKISISFRQRSILASLGSTDLEYTSCIVCDENLKTVLNIRNDSVKKTYATNLSSTSESIMISRPRDSSRNIMHSNNDIVNSSRQNLFNGERLATRNNFSRETTNSNLINQNDIRNQPTSSNRTMDGNINANLNNDEDQLVLCSKCNHPATRLTTKREGPNKGRQFYTCKASDQCNFFKWADDLSSIPPAQSTSSWNSSQTRSFNNPNVRQNQGSSTSNENNGRTANKRKCSVCRQEGHTKKTCRLNPSSNTFM